MSTLTQEPLPGPSVKLHGVFSITKMNGHKTHPFANTLWIAKRETVLRELYIYSGAAMVVNDDYEARYTPTVSFTKEMLIEKDAMQLYTELSVDDQDKRPVIIAPSLIEAWQTARKIPYRLMHDDMGSCDAVTLTGEMLYDDFDNDGDSVSIPLDSLGKVYGCTGIQHMPEDKWEWIIG